MESDVLREGRTLGAIPEFHLRWEAIERWYENSGVELIVEKCLRDYDIRNASTLHLVGRVPGGYE